MEYLHPGNDYEYNSGGFFDGRKRRQAEESGVQHDDRRRRQVEDRRCKSPGCRNDGYCNNQASQRVNIGVFSRQDIGALGAQSVYHANAGDQVNTEIYTTDIEPRIFRLV